MTNKTFDDSNWREEYKNYTSSKTELELLENGAKSLSQSWILSALYQKWKRINGIPPDPADLIAKVHSWSGNSTYLGFYPTLLSLLLHRPIEGFDSVERFVLTLL